jgi:cell division septation protein DedD
MAVWYKKSKGYSLLNKIKSHNHEYKIINTMRNNRDVKLVVVGPFQTKSEAKRNLRSLKSIKSDAFITTL